MNEVVTHTEPLPSPIQIVVLVLAVVVALAHLVLVVQTGCQKSVRKSGMFFGVDSCSLRSGLFSNRPESALPALLLCHGARSTPSSRLGITNSDSADSQTDFWQTVSATAKAWWKLPGPQALLGTLLCLFIPVPLVGPLVLLHLVKRA